MGRPSMAGNEIHSIPVVETISGKDVLVEARVWISFGISVTNFSSRQLLLFLALNDELK